MSSLPPFLKSPWLILAFVCGLAFFWQLGRNGLFDLDEALYANCAREMRLTGDYVVPRVNGEPFFEKPPLIYWEAAAAYALFGRNETTTRLPSAIATTLLVGLVFWFGSKYFGKRAGLLAALFFALSPLTLGAARQLTTDATLNLCIFAALVFFFLAYTSTNPAGKRWMLGFWAGCGFGVLAKGLPGILIPVVVAFLTICFTENFKVKPILKSIFNVNLALGILLFLVIVLPWHIAAWNSSGEAFYHEYIVRQHLQRFRGGDTSHLAPFWFFIPGFLVGAFPWSLFVPSALKSRREATEIPTPADLARTMLKIWAVVVFVMFSASGSKLISYILPMYPAAALLAGDWCSRAIDRKRARVTLLVGGGIGFVLCSLLCAVVLFHAPIIKLIEAQTHKPVRMDQVPAGMLTWAGHLFGIVALTMGLFLVFVMLEKRARAFAILCAGMLLFTGVAVIEGLPIIDTGLLAPLQRTAAIVGEEALKTHTPLLLVTGRTRRPSPLFYLPDAIIGKTVEQGGVAETTDTVKMLDIIRQRRPWIVLADDEHAKLLEGEPSITWSTEKKGWTILHALPAPASASHVPPPSK